MEKKLPEDHLERFLRNSFEKFGDSPSPKVWDRIEAGLGGQPSVITRRMPGLIWTAAASIVAILGIVVFILARANQELKAELKQVQTLAQKNEGYELNEKKTENAENRTKEERGVMENEANERNENIERNDALKVDRPLSAGNFLPDSKNKASYPRLSKNDLAIRGTEKRTDPGNKDRTSKPLPATQLAEPTVDKIQTVREKQSSALKTLDPKELHESSFNQERIRSGSLDQIALQELAIDNNFVLPAADLDFISVAGKPAGRSTLGLTGGLLSERGTVKPLRPFDPRDAEQEKNTYHSMNSWQAGLELERTLGRYFSITGGVNFKHLEFVNEINHTLTFRNREQHKPGRPPHQHDFRYRMHGPTGVSEFEINSEQLDSRATIDDSEMIKVNIVDQSALNYLSIPVTAGYHFHLGRWQAFAKAGIQSDFLIGRSVDDPVVRITHPQLALKNNKPLLSNSPSHTIGFNGLVQAGVKYRLASQWGLQLNPSWLVPLTRRDPHIQSNAQAFSFQAGLTYTFASL